MWINSEEKYRGRIFSLWVGQVRLDNGEIYNREIIRHNGSVAIVPVIDNSVILIRQFRISIGREILELPAGRLEKDESPEVCADRELQEEIGYRTGKMLLATDYYSSVGFTDEKMYIFLALDLHKVMDDLEPDERVHIVRIPIAEVADKLIKNEFEDSKTIIGLRELLVYLGTGKSIA